MYRNLRFLFLPAMALGCSAWAQDAPKPDTKPPHAARQTWEQHFNTANLAHDGHLTLDEAKGGYGAIAKHFQDIDVDGKGYVTANDIRAWHAMRKMAHRLTQPSPPPDPLRPRNAMQHEAMATQMVPVGEPDVATHAVPAAEADDDEED